MPLLRFDSTNSQGLSEVRVKVRLFFWRGLRTPGRAAAQGVSGRAHRAAGQGYGANEATVSGDAGRVRGRSAGRSCRNANAGEGSRFSACDAGWRRQRRFFAEHAGFPRGGTDVSVTDAGCRARGARRIERARADSDFLSLALCDSGCGEAGLQRVLRARVAFPKNDGVPAVYVAGQRDRARYEPGKDDSLVAAAFGIFFTV